MDTNQAKNACERKCYRAANFCYSKTLQPSHKYIVIAYRSTLYHVNDLIHLKDKKRKQIRNHT